MGWGYETGIKMEFARLVGLVEVDKSHVDTVKWVGM